MFNLSFMCPVLLRRHVLFGFNSDALVATPCIFVYLLNLCKFFIWQSRNDLRFRNTRLGAVGCSGHRKGEVSLEISPSIFFRRFRSEHCRRYFHRQWCARGVVATVSDSYLVFPAWLVPPSSLSFRSVSCVFLCIALIWTLLFCPLLGLLHWCAAQRRFCLACLRIWCLVTLGLRWTQP